MVFILFFIFGVFIKKEKEIPHRLKEKQVHIL